MRTRVASFLVALAVTIPAIGGPRPAPAATEDLATFLSRFVDGTFDPELQAKQAAIQEEAKSRAARGLPRSASADIGEIAVLEDDGTLIVGGISNSDEIVRRFYESHPDQYGQIFLNFNFPMEPEAGFAFESNVANDVQGIGLPIFNGGAAYGTVNLMSYLNQNDLGEYANFTQYNAILGQESGHRFASFVETQTCSGSSGFLLGRDCAHWNFYNHSLGSTLEGNNWTDNGDGTFTTSSPFSTYGEIDEYLFGLRGAAAVTQPLYVIENPTNCLNGTTPITCPSEGAGPRNNITATGTRTNYTMADIIAKYGPRVPDAATAPKTFRVAFIMVVPQGGFPPAAADLSKLDSFRTQWEIFFAAETNGLGTMETRLYLPGEPPHPAFTATPRFGIPGTSVQFTDDTRNGPATSWLWDFGDGSTSAAQNPAHVYTTPGLYDVSLTVSNANGTESRTKTAYIDIQARAPQTEFTADLTIGSAPLTVAFTDQTTWNPASWLWDFGDGSTSTVQNPTHVYTAPNRSFTVTLTTTNAYGSNTRGRGNYIVTATSIYAETFETGGTGWTHGANAGTDDWQVGPPLGDGGDPPAAHGGVNVYGTDLGGAPPDGLYERNVDTWLESPDIDGSGATYVAATFWRWLGVEDAVYDQARLLVDGATYFQNPVGTGSTQLVDTTWKHTVADISADAAGDPAFRLRFTMASDGLVEFCGWNIDDVVVYSTPGPTYTQGPRILAGPGHGAANPNQAGLFDARGQRIVQWTAYGAGSMGTNVASGDVDGDTYHEALTGPGPGFTLGPQVRGFNGWDGSPIAKINFYAYGTLRYGVNVAAGNVDGDGFEELVTGPGAGAVFGPHVRGWNYDASTVSAISKINYFAYGTLKYGCLVASGQVDSDSTFDEIMTGAGPGAVFQAHLRGWNYDGTAVTALPNFTTFAFPSTTYGVNVAVADVNGGRQEILTGKGPAPANDAALRAFRYSSNNTLTQLPGSDLVPFTSMYGVRVSGGDLGSRDAHLVAGPGPDPAATSALKGYTFASGTWQADPNLDFVPYGTMFGTIAAVGPIE